MDHLLSKVREEGRKVVFLDEAVFSFNTFSTKAWASPYQSIKVNDFSIRVRTQALICCVSEDIGLETYMIRPRAINTDTFVEFLEQIAEHFDGEKIAVFLDNLSVHKTVRSREAF